MDIAVRKLRPDGDRSTFNSRDPDLDRFFKRFAGQNQFRHYVGTTYVAEEAGLLVGTACCADVPCKERKWVWLSSCSE